MRVMSGLQDYDSCDAFIIWVVALVLGLINNLNININSACWGNPYKLILLLLQRFATARALELAGLCGGKGRTTYRTVCGDNAALNPPLQTKKANYRDKYKQTNQNEEGVN